MKTNPIFYILELVFLSIIDKYLVFVFLAYLFRRSPIKVKGAGCDSWAQPNLFKVNIVRVALRK